MEMRLDKRGSTAQLARQNAKSSRLDEPGAFEYFVGGTTTVISLRDSISTPPLPRGVVSGYLVSLLNSVKEGD